MMIIRCLVPMDLDVKMKAVALGALFLIVNLFFSPQNNHIDVLQFPLGFCQFLRTAKPSIIIIAIRAENIQTSQ